MVALNTLTRKVQRLEDLHFVQSDLDLRQDLLRAMATDRGKHELARETMIEDTDLIDRLYGAGFTAENISALSVAPIAMVAWGSGYVTPEERSAAVHAVFYSEVSGNRAAISKFQSWLENRPSDELLRLWADYTRATRCQSAEGDEISEHLIGLAKQVALASGGFLGFGTICDGEQRVIDWICDVLETR